MHTIDVTANNAQSNHWGTQHTHPYLGSSQRIPSKKHGSLPATVLEQSIKSILVLLVAPL
jgi:hypothetical protein